MLHHEVWERERLVNMRAEVERDRLGARLRESRHQEPDGSPSKGIVPPRGVFARSAAFATALFR
jgi:hypothetical protein